MNITFQITTGTVTNDDDGTVLSSSAYAGNDSRTPQNPNKIQGKNNPDKCSLHCIGPLPPGIYSIGTWGTYDVGQNAAPLTPINVPEIYGRSGFYIHGQEAPTGVNYLQESEGCIVVPHNDRMTIIKLAPAQVTVII